MSWESPIDIVYDDITEKIEAGVFEVLQKVNISVDRDELIRALDYDRGQYEKGYADGVKAQPEKIGLWDLDTGISVCTACGKSPGDWVYIEGSEKWPFCPLCGAKMEGSINDE